MEQSEQGVVTSTSHYGSVTQVVIETGSDVVVLTADSNMLFRALRALDRPSLVGVRIEFERTEWPGGLLSFSVIEDGHVVCPNCRRHIPQHLNADYCVFGRHPVKKMRPSNGAEADD